MRQVLFVAVLFVGVIVVAVSPAQAQPKITGGAELIPAGGNAFSLPAHAIETRNGVKGNIQYSRENQSVADLFVHAKTQCYGISGDGMRAVLAGPCEPQYDPGGACVDWLVVWIQEGGTGAGDSVRVFFLPMANAVLGCLSPDGANIFPGIVQEGNFTIRP